MVLLRSESPSGKCAKLHTVAASNNRNHMPWSRFAYASRYLQSFTCQYHQRWHATITLLLLVLRAHPVRVESHIQPNANGEVATTSPPFCNEPHRSHVLFVKSAPGTTFTSWSQHHVVVIGKPEWQVRKASHCGSKQR